MITNEQKELIAIEVIRTLRSQFEKFPDEETVNRNAPFHELFLKTFSEKFKNRIKSIPDFISLASWMHGLNTSLGQSFFEKTSHILSGGVKKPFTTEKNTNLKISKEQKDIVKRIVLELSNGNRKPSVLEENAECVILGKLFEEEATDFTVDVFLENDTQIICLELKTVRPNKGTFKSEKEKVLEAKFALKNQYPNKEILYYIGFPFDPESETPTGYDKDRFMDYSVDFRKFFSKDEFLLAAELWDFLSKENGTMDIILEIISKITKPNFLRNFEYLNNSENIKMHPLEYADYSLDWNLYSIARIAQSIPSLPQNVISKKKFQQKIMQPLFSNKMKYNNQRIKYLLEDVKSATI